MSSQNYKYKASFVVGHKPDGQADPQVHPGQQQGKI